MIYLSIFLMLTGVAVRTTSYMTLDNPDYWRLQYPLKIISKGMYKYIRHPMFLGSMITCVGLYYLLTRHIGITIALMLVSIDFIIQRIDIEESLMEQKFGDEFIDYRNKTKRLIPFLT